MSIDILDRQVRRTQNVIDATLQENETSRHILAQWLTATPSREDGGPQEQQQEKALFPRCATAASTTRGSNHHRTCPPFRSGTPPPSSSSSVVSDPNGFLFEGLRRSLQKPLSSSSGSFFSLPPTPAALPVKVKKDGKGNAVPSTSPSAMGRSLETETELLPTATAALHHVVAPPAALGLFERLLYRVAYSTVDSFLPCETLYRQVLQYLPLQLSERFFRLSLGVSLVAVAVEADRSDRVSAVDVLLSQVEPSVWSRADRHEIFRHLYAFTVWHLVYHSTASWCSQWRQQSTQGERAAPTSAVVEGRGSCSPSFSPHPNDAAASLKMIQYFTNSEEVHIRLPPEVQQWAMWRAGVAEVSVQVLTLALAALRRCRANRSLHDELWHSGYVSTLRNVVRIPKADPFSSSPIWEQRKHKPQPQEATNDDDEAARMMKVEPHHHHSHHREPHDESLSSLLDRSLRIVQRQETSKQNREAVEEGKSFSRRTRLEHHTRRLGTALPTALLQRRTVSSSLDAHRSRAALMTADQSVLFERRREQGARTASNAKGQQAAIDARRRQRYLSSLPIETMVLISWV